MKSSKRPRRPSSQSGAIVVAFILAAVAGWIATMEAEQATGSPQARPAGWFPSSHGNSAKPDYTRVFALDRVHEVRISIDAATFRAMREDLSAVLPLGAPGPEVGRGGGLA